MPDPEIPPDYPPEPEIPDFDEDVETVVYTEAPDIVPGAPPIWVPDPENPEEGEWVEQEAVQETYPGDPIDPNALSLAGIKETVDAQGETLDILFLALLEGF